ncbi:MAG: bifunctional folylpolyglutamate synthase/dihydrofolate synthase [Syntrophobacteraceae bacterium]|jgi:dihydrofolate synthase/folylpolyglutamate synthase|nr:bifunctional folylpolyglutamate synthase/dihydrofolate synthase [Syntrophobacteraceae bacterium]
MMESSALNRYKTSIDYLYGLQKYGIKFGLNSTERILERLGNPERRLRCIHVGGTNGKGSTAAMLSSVLRAHGLRVGLYTSPHLVRFTERFRVDEREADVERILEVFERVRSVLDDSEPPTFFEMVTAMAFQYFLEEQVDWAVIEVGMGGRLDATNVIRPEVSIITNVSYDHQEFLGNSLAAIAREKAGIIKEEVPLVTGARQPVVKGILKATCFSHHAPVFCLGSQFRVRRNPDGTFQYHGIKRKWRSLELNLKGAHQFQNAALALAALEVVKEENAVPLDAEVIREALLDVRWPCRLEVLQESPLVILDGAHNPHGAESLRDALKSCFDYEKLHLVLGIMADKDTRGILRRLLPLAETAIFTKPRYARAEKPETLKRLARPYVQKHYVIPDPAAAIAEARAMASPNDAICIAGSLYFAGEVKELLGEHTISI